ncbi:ATP-binding protein [Mycobacterium sp.]|uniref:ATP-binding protein n=1 Tax=Mycobacterium sp. TaxID=1785 RepID=UPI002DA63C1F|nr:AAA family ATPase [Mycobacterium sp.]
MATDNDVSLLSRFAGNASHLPTHVIGRSVEFSALETFLQSASVQPAGLVIEGEAGIGKTTLWLAAVEQARERGFQVLSARVGQNETLLAYAALADLLGGVSPAVLTRLPDVQRVAVDRVLLRDTNEGTPTDQRVLAAALVSVVHALAQEAPILVAIDDVQWLDSSSQAVVAFAARRFNRRVGVLATEGVDAETGSASWLQLAIPDAVERIRVGPLSLSCLHNLISTRLGHSLSRPTMVRISEVSGGNPFYAVELARAIDAVSTNSDSVLPATLAELMRIRVGRLDRQAQDVLLAASCVANPTVELLAMATHNTVDRIVELLDEPESNGVIGIEGNRVRFAHPLLARSIFSEASPARRRAIHRSLANALALPELKARHMALAAASTDPETLHALDTAVASARARGAPAAAAELVELAIGLGGDRPSRRIRAAEHHFKAGDANRARALLESTIDHLRPGLLRSIALNLLAGIRIYEDAFGEAAGLLKRALDDAERNQAVLVQTLMSLAFTQAMSAEFDDSIRNARQAVTHAEELAHPGLISRALAMLVTTRSLCGHDVDQAILKRALALEDPDADISIPFCASAVHALALAWAGELDEARTVMHTLRQRCVERGAENDMMAVTGYCTLIEIWRGNFVEAAQLADDTIERAEQVGGSRAVALALRASVAAYSGQESDARADAAAALAIARQCGSPRLAEWATVSLGFLEVSLGRYAEAISTYQPLLQTFEASPGTQKATALFIPDAVEALIALGRNADAERLIRTLEDVCDGHGRSWMVPVAGRCRSMWLAARGDVTAANRTARAAMAEHERLPMPFERARTQLWLGQLQRRQRQKDAARATFLEALEAFGTLGTPVWADRARAELARVNVAAPRDLTLTSSERRVAELAASGMTNRDIAAGLFISPKTVEAKLARVYRKLGIRRRAELGKHIGTNGNH